MGSDKNWWEFYFVRYFIGSIVGILIILAIALHPDSGVSPVISKFINFKVLEIKDISIPFLLSLLFLGTAFCYISSAPILVLHTMRFNIDYTSSKESSCCKKIAFCFIFIIVYSIIWYFFDFDLIKGIMSLIAFIIIYCEIYLIITLFKSKKREFFEFYKRLAKNRANRKVECTEYVESYRHLREHGNAFLILFCEAVLGMALFSCSSINQIMIIVLFWLLPTIPVWIIGSYLESRLKDI